MAQSRRLVLLGIEILEDNPKAVAELSADFPAGHRQAVDYSEHRDPGRAVDMLLMAARETAAKYTDKRIYRETAALLVCARNRAPDPAKVEHTVTELREEYQRRTLIQRIFTEHGLP